MTSIVFTQFDDDLPVDVNKEYHVSQFTRDTGLHEIHKLCLFPEKLREYIQNQFKIKEDVTTNFKYTPLMIAARNGVTESVKLLLEYGSKLSLDINLQNDDGWTALMLACRFCNTDSNIECVKLLLEYGADVNLQNDINGWTALMLACIYCNTDSNIECVKLLLERKADINFQSEDGYTALSLACANCNNTSNIQCVKLILEQGADINLQNNNGWTALMFACYYCNICSSIQCVKLLLEYGADINLQNKDGWSALMFACTLYTTSSIQCVKLLLGYTSKKELDDIINTVSYIRSLYNILSNISNVNINFSISILQLTRLTHFDYNSILLFELKKCII